jgi:hypothetical protein
MEFVPYSQKAKPHGNFHALLPVIPELIASAIRLSACVNAIVEPATARLCPTSEGHRDV